MSATVRNFALVLTLAVASAIASVALARTTAGTVPPTLSAGYAGVGGMRSPSTQATCASTSQSSCSAFAGMSAERQAM